MRFSAMRRLGVKTCAAVGSTARDLVEFTNLMKPFKSRKLLRHLEGRPSGPNPPDWATTTSQSSGGEFRVGAGAGAGGAGQDLINTTRA